MAHSTSTEDEAGRITEAIRLGNLEASSPSEVRPSTHFLPKLPQQSKVSFVFSAVCRSGLPTKRLCSETEALMIVRRFSKIMSRSRGPSLCSTRGLLVLYLHGANTHSFAEAKG